ncbi:MAG: DUF1996 domain-containing protein [Actinobacteria bacterium]|nr:DUF1996 domain-containing protein [Actinomycetota bacterium]
MSGNDPTEPREPTGPRSRGRALLMAAVVVVAVIVGGSLVVAAGSDDGDAAASDGSTWPPALRAADGTSTATATRHTGPQGRVGQFVAKCQRDHSAPDDPIVFPGLPGRSHMHEFYGAVGVDADTTPASMLAADTTCDKPADRASYWHPTVYDHGEAVVASELDAYYRAAPGVDPTEVSTMPFGLALIAGDMTYSTPQPGESVGWTCGVRSTLSDEPPTCPESAPLTFLLVFQDCWDGEHLDSVDHRSHAAYSTDGECPDGYPVHLPQLTVSVTLPIFGEGHDLSLASGNVYSLHGDFFNGWHPEGLEREIDGCIRRDVVCDLRTNRSEPTNLEDLFS